MENKINIWAKTASDNGILPKIQELYSYLNLKFQVLWTVWSKFSYPPVISTKILVRQFLKLDNDMCRS